MSAPGTITTLAGDADAVLEAIHAAILADPDLAVDLGAPARAHDTVPARPSYPYLTYGTVRSEDRSADGLARTAHRLSLHVWTRDGSRSEVLSLLSRAQRAVTTRVSHRVLPLYTDVFDLPETRRAGATTRHGLLHLSIITETET